MTNTDFNILFILKHFNIKVQIKTEILREDKATHPTITMVSYFYYMLGMLLAVILTLSYFAMFSL
jgi:hypothetical protein